MSRPKGGLSAAAVPQDQAGDQRTFSQVGSSSEGFIMLFPAARCCEPHQKHLYPHRVVFVGCACLLEFIVCFQGCVRVRPKARIMSQLFEDDLRS